MTLTSSYAAVLGLGLAGRYAWSWDNIWYFVVFVLHYHRPWAVFQAESQNMGLQLRLSQYQLQLNVCSNFWPLFSFVGKSLVNFIRKKMPRELRIISNLHICRCVPTYVY